MKENVEVNIKSQGRFSDISDYSLAILLLQIMKGTLK